MKNKQVVGIFIILLFLAAFLYHNYSYPGDEAQKVLKIALNISREVEEIRELPFKGDPEIKVLTQEEALKKWGPSKRDYENIKKWELIYKMTLLVPPEYNLTKTRTKETASWIAVTSGDKVYIISENFFRTGDTSQRVLAHEFTHVLQKQYFNPEYPETLDGSLAVKALVEGDADLTADIYCKMHGIKIEKITSFYLADPPLNFGYFPYVFGDHFVEYLYSVGGWNLINNAYSNPPQTTQQIMHPELYLNKTLPRKLDIDIDESYKIFHADRLGEFYFYLIMITNGVNPDSALTITRAWNGDLIILAENSTHYVLIWKSSWKNEESANEIYKLLLEKARKTEVLKVQITLDGHILTLRSVLPKQ
ncbi:DUF4157 domain-containing protein [Thermococcus argininiproducens]|uniref:DUF4157 domain-containing protein n=1 Tax=Thermococcus argininiproducens TaxID=2866384 RepID=A0A9E7SD06_9EURY|nr:DUF4157 domain-containing protein [Thermococcus argininiproducens]USG99637.1 DUF4157 domain-containing protein [Thermococcus argininiproducens]